MGRIHFQRKGEAITVCSPLKPIIRVIHLLFMCKWGFISVFFAAVAAMADVSKHDSGQCQPQYGKYVTDTTGNQETSSLPPNLPPTLPLSGPQFILLSSQGNGWHILQVQLSKLPCACDEFGFSSEEESHGTEASVVRHWVCDLRQAYSSYLSFSVLEAGSICIPSEEPSMPTLQHQTHTFPPSSWVQLGPISSENYSEDHGDRVKYSAPGTE